MLLSGSMRPDSCSFAAIKYASEYALELGWSVDLVNVRELDLPMYVPNWQIGDYRTGRESIDSLIQHYRQADALVWASPAYHGTITGAIKNALDFAEFLSSDQPAYLQEKRVGIIAINDSEPLAAMRAIARELRAWLAPTQVTIPEADFGPNRALNHERHRGRLRRLISEVTTGHWTLHPGSVGETNAT